MQNRIVTPKVGFKNGDGKISERVCFPMREISASEESEFWASLAAIADKPKNEKAALTFDLMIDFIANCTEEMPFVRTSKDGKDIDKPLKGIDPASAVRDYFKERTARKDRMVNSLINAYSNELAANVVF
jgi:hypothetical protein